MALTTAGNGKIDCLFTGFRTHQFPPAAKIPCPGKTVFATQIAIVGHMQAQ